MTKQEFKALTKRDFTDKEYETIETVYTFHPSISETEGKQQIANLHRGYAGDIGTKIDTTVTALYSASFETKSFSGYGTTTMTVYAFEDDQRRLIIWKTAACCMEFEVGQKFRLTGTIKANNVYRDEEQTIVNRPKITLIAE